MISTGIILTSPPRTARTNVSCSIFRTNVEIFCGLFCDFCIFVVLLKKDFSSLIRIIYHIISKKSRNGTRFLGKKQQDAAKRRLVFGFVGAPTPGSLFVAGAAHRTVPAVAPARELPRFPAVQDRENAPRHDGKQDHDDQKRRPVGRKPRKHGGSPFQVFYLVTLTLRSSLSASRYLRKKSM